MSVAKHTHILVFPYPAQGHMLPILDLTHQLALHGLTITILITPKNLPILTPLLSAHPPTSIETLLLPFPPHPEIPPGVENVKDIGNHGNRYIINALAKLQHPIIQWFKSHPNPPVALVSDFFLGWTLHLANQLNIPRIAFFSSGPFVAAVLDYCWRNLEAVRSASTVVNFHDIPGLPSFKQEHLPSVVRRYRELDPESEFLRISMLANAESWGSFFNSFQDLEAQYLDHLRAKMGHSRVYAVGPLSLLSATVVDAGNGCRANLNLDLSVANVATWLDGCPDGSVVYVCFGSQKLPNRQQMEALASGLERSRVRFVWAVKRGTAQQVEDGIGVVPDGFEERVGGRGLVIKGWAPQVLILGHRAVGGFVSHCGWNSVLEAIVAGVLVLGWPMEADQFVNARLLVEDMGVAVKVCEGEDAVPEPAELGKAIAEAMTGETPVKVRAKELREKAFAAVGGGGSSSKDLDEFVKELNQLKVGRKSS
ncbi:hypothetical protein ACFX11_021067 [Malus domestica]